MSNRQFFGEAKDVYNETTYTTVPATFGNNNVFVTQSLNRNVCDTTSTSITGYPQLQVSKHPSLYQNNFTLYPSQVLQGQRHFVPGGVAYTFNRQTNTCLPQYCSPLDPQYMQQLNRYQLHDTFPFQQQQAQPSMTLQQQIALKNLEMQGLENLLLQEYLQKNPLKRQFHYDQQTSTSEPCLWCKQMANETKVALQHANQQKPTCFCSKGLTETDINEVCTTTTCGKFLGKRLHLSKSPDLKCKPNPDDFDVTIKMIQEQCSSGSNGAVETEQTELSHAQSNGTTHQTDMNYYKQQTESKVFSDQEIQTDSFGKDKPKATSTPRNRKQKKEDKKKKKRRILDNYESDFDSDGSI